MEGGQTYQKSCQAKKKKEKKEKILKNEKKNHHNGESFPCLTLAKKGEGGGV